LKFFVNNYFMLTEPHFQFIPRLCASNMLHTSLMFFQPVIGMLPISKFIMPQ
jgi:hypothetical protein